MRCPSPLLFALAAFLVGASFPAVGAGEKPGVGTGSGQACATDAGPSAGHRPRRRLVGHPPPLFLETPTASLAAPWLKALDLAPSPAAVVHAMNPYHIQRILSDTTRNEIHAAGMAGFYTSPQLKESTLETLQLAYQTRSKIMRLGGIYLSRNLTGEGFWEIVEPQPEIFHYEITDAILNAAASGAGGSLMVIQPYASWDQLAAGYPPKTENDSLFAGGDFFVLKQNTGPGPAFDLPAYESFLTHLDQHTGQKVFEIANEMDGGSGASYPNSEGALAYIELLRSSRKGLGPDATIVNGGSIGFLDVQANKDFWITFFSHGGGALIDALNVHYPGEWNQAFQDSSELGEFLDFFNGVMAANSVVKDIWITEFVIGDPSFDEQQVAEWYLKRFCFAAVRGTKKIFIEFSDFRGSHGLAPLGRSAMFYTEGETFTAQLMFYTQKLINLKLSSFAHCTELVRDEQYEFTVDGHPVYVVWGVGSPPTALAGHVVKVTDVFGNETITSTPVLTSRPVFVEILE
jgi:hypothetical protein